MRNVYKWQTFKIFSYWTFEISSHFEDKYVYCVVHVEVKALFWFVTFINIYRYSRAHKDTRTHSHRLKFCNFLGRSRSEIKYSSNWDNTGKFNTNEIQVFLVTTSSLIKILGKLREINWHFHYLNTRWGSSFLKKFQARIVSKGWPRF